MCGIAGILRIHPPGQPPPKPWDAIPEPWLDILDDSIKHRGPDGAGRFRDRATRPDGSVVDVALVHRRLSIIDHSGGHQPMVSLAKGEGVVPVKTYALGEGLGLYEPGEYERLRTRSASEEASAPRHPDLVAVVFNGCIYNHRELRKELLAAGHVFSTDHSDTEVLVHGWREWKDHLPVRLSAMFAFGLWDHAAGVLFLARDLFGEKPVFFTRLNATTVAFSSACAGLSRLDVALGNSIRPVRRILANWIRLGFHEVPPWPVGELGPGCSVRFDPFEHVFPYHVHAFPSSEDEDEGQQSAAAPRSTASLELAIDELLRAAVANRLEADVPLGCFLSGGVDSSLIASFAQDAMGNLQTFSVRMPAARYDESPYAQAVADRLGTRHTTLECSVQPAIDLPSLITKLGLPFGDSSLLPTHWVSVASRQHTRVALAGDGGDELFAGYDRHRALRMVGGRAGSVIGHIPSALLPQRDPKATTTKIARLAHAMRTNDLYELLALFQTSDLRQLLPDVDLADLVRMKFHGAFVSDNVGAADALRWLDMFRYLPHDLLRKTDTASMSVALEVRVPMLDRNLAELARSLDVADLMPHNQRKGLLRQVARKYFPADIVDRPKMGFAIPIGEWFRSDYGSMRTLLLDHLNSAEPFGPPSLGIDLNMKFIRQMLKEHDEAGEASLFPWKGRDHSQRLYMLLVLSIWAKWLGSLAVPSRA
jgi:asparagine synthase (glutamine-hydrolysing)